MLARLDRRTVDGSVQPDYSRWIYLYNSQPKNQASGNHSLTEFTFQDVFSHSAIPRLLKATDEVEL